MKNYRAVVLPAYNDNLLRAMLSLRTDEKSLPALKPGEVLIRMQGAPCNPSDIAFLRGGYNIVKPLPAVPGFEGTGTVVETGSQAGELLGKRVSSFIQEGHDGTWAEYFTARARDCIVLKEELDWQQAACLSINPLTAWGMMELAAEKGCRAIILNAAGGQVPRLMQKLAGKKGIEVINVVRKEAHVESLKAEGAVHVLATGDERFVEELDHLCRELKPTMAFDAVAGELAGTMLNAMPGGSSLVVYGALSGELLSGTDPMGIIFRKKSITGFNLNDWIADKTPEQFRTLTDALQDLLIGGELSVGIQGTYPLDKVVDGMRSYIKSMSAGKILLTP